MRVVATYCIHYGLQHLDRSVRSVAPLVDEVVAFYSSRPSHGKDTDAPCPESEGDLRAKFLDTAKDADVPATWLRIGASPGEAFHRSIMEHYSLAARADAQLVVDADEVWPSDQLEAFLNRGKHSTARFLRAPAIHWWQGEELACTDPLQPVRLHMLGNENLVEEFCGELRGFEHFGYAISDELMEYKWKIHGHKDELRKGWFEEKWLARATDDVHPTNVDFWYARAYDREWR